MTEDTSRLFEICVSPEQAGLRLDQLLADQTEGLSRTRIKALIKDGKATLGGRTIEEPNYRVNADEDIALMIPAPEDPEPSGEDIPLDILFEDPHLIVINKPAGLVVHPGPGNWSGTLVNALIAHCGDSLSGIGGVKRPGIVHRLDKDTSGVMVVAKSDAAHQGLADQFADHGNSGNLERAYQALVWGAPQPARDVIDATLGRSDRNRLKRAVVKDTRPDARHAVTHYHVRRIYGGGADTLQVALVECRLETGRTHQIRVHMAHIGHPLLGDALYGQGFKTRAARLSEDARAALQNLSRQALHAFLLKFTHPETGEEMEFSTPFPPDLAKLRDALAAL